MTKASAFCPCPCGFLLQVLPLMRAGRAEEIACPSVRAGCAGHVQFHQLVYTVLTCLDNQQPDSIPTINKVQCAVPHQAAKADCTVVFPRFLQTVRDVWTSLCLKEPSRLMMRCVRVFCVLPRQESFNPLPWH